MDKKKESFYIRNMELIDALMPILAIGVLVILLTPCIFYHNIQSKDCEKIASNMYNYEDISCDYAGNNICNCLMHKYEYLTKDNNEVYEDFTINKKFEVKKDKK